MNNEELKKILEPEAIEAPSDLVKERILQKAEWAFVNSPSEPEETKKKGVSWTVFLAPAFCLTMVFVVIVPEFRGGENVTDLVDQKSSEDDPPQIDSQNFPASPPLKIIRDGIDDQPNAIVAEPVRIAWLGFTHDDPELSSVGVLAAKALVQQIEESPSFSLAKVDGISASKKGFTTETQVVLQKQGIDTILVGRIYRENSHYALEVKIYIGKQNHLERVQAASLESLIQSTEELFEKINQQLVEDVSQG